MHTCKSCSNIFKFKRNLTTHLWTVHNIGNGKIHKCTQPDCKYTTKSKSDLTRHLWTVHNIGKGKIHKCTQPDCIYTTKTKSHLTTHLWTVHNIGNGKIHKCTHPDCIYTTKTKSHLTNHLWEVHNIGNGKIHKCTHPGCKHTTKRKRDLTRHLVAIHDSGNIECNFCRSNVFKVFNYKDTHGLHKICRRCYGKATGYSTNKEKQMVEYLRKNPKIGPYIFSEDSIIRGTSCNTRRRPDCCIGSRNKLIIILECDENQHRGYEAGCQDSRLSEIYNELSNAKMCVTVRWNPDYYKENGKRGVKSRKERLELLERFILFLVNQNIGYDNYGKVYYMFYSEDNDTITKYFPKKMIYDKFSV